MKAQGVKYTITLDCKYMAFGNLTAVTWNRKKRKESNPLDLCAWVWELWIINSAYPEKGPSRPEATRNPNPLKCHGRYWDVCVDCHWEKQCDWDPWSGSKRYKKQTTGKTVLLLLGRHWWRRLSFTRIASERFLACLVCIELKMSFFQSMCNKQTFETEWSC